MKMPIIGSHGLGGGKGWGRRGGRGGVCRGVGTVGGTLFFVNRCVHVWVCTYVWCGVWGAGVRGEGDGSVKGWG